MDYNLLAQFLVVGIEFFPLLFLKLQALVLICKAPGKAANPSYVQCSSSVTTLSWAPLSAQPLLPSALTACDSLAEELQGKQGALSYLWWGCISLSALVNVSWWMVVKLGKCTSLDPESNCLHQHNAFIYSMWQWTGGKALWTHKEQGHMEGS